MSNFRFKYPMGSRVPIEVEDNELVQMPGQAPQQVNGATHEQGGIDMDVPEGTKIYSDKLAVDDETMKDRKKRREEMAKKLMKLLEKDPTSALIRNTVERSVELLQIEDQQDMQLQEAAQKIYEAPQDRQQEEEAPEDIPYEDMPEEGDEDMPRPMEEGYRYGGYSGVGREKYQYGPGPGLGLYNGNGPYYGKDPNTDPWKYASSIGTSVGTTLTDTEFNDRTTGYDFQNIPKSEPIVDPYATKTPSSDADVANSFNKYIEDMRHDRAMDDYNIKNKQFGRDTEVPLGIGDYVGLGAGIGGAFAGLKNTNDAMRATLPNRNRFRGVGEDAIRNNWASQDMLADQFAEGQIDINTSANSQMGYNRNSALNVNTLRGLDFGTNEIKKDALRKNRSDYGKMMADQFNQMGQLTNWRDEREAYGELEADDRTAKDIDNYYSNKAANIADIAENFQGIGTALNTSKSNTWDNRYMSLMNPYGLAFSGRTGELMDRPVKPPKRTVPPTASVTQPKIETIDQAEEALGMSKGDLEKYWNDPDMQMKIRRYLQSQGYSIDAYEGGGTFNPSLTG